MLTRHFRKTQFYIESSDKYEGYTKGERWNGWECPRFTKDVAMKIMNDFYNDEFPAWYDENLDAFIYYNQNAVGKKDFYKDNLTQDEIDEYFCVYEGFDIEGLHLYPIGAWFWIWDEYEPEIDDEE